MAKLKIAILATSLLPPHPAGTQMMEVIDKLGEDFEFTVFGKEIDNRLLGKVRFVRVPVPLKPLLLRYTVQFIVYGFLFKRKQLNKHFDIVHAIEPVSPYATLATMQYCAKAAEELMNTGVVEYKGWRKPYYKLLLGWGGKMEQWMVANKYLKGIIVPSKGLQADILKHHKKKPEIDIIPNGVEFARFKNAKSFRQEVRKKLSINENDFVGIIAGLGDWERKGLGHLIAAISSLRNDSVKIIVVGGGNIDSYKQECIKRGIQSSFIFIGITNELEKYYGASDFFILPTANEAWSVVTLMAAASGLPLLATEVNGVEDFIIEGENGFFIERNADNIAQKMMHLKSISNIESMGQNSAKFARQFDTDHVAQLYAAYYRKFASFKSN